MTIIPVNDNIKPIKLYFSCSVFDCETNLDFIKSKVIPENYKLRFVIDSNILIYSRNIVLDFLNLQKLDPRYYSIEELYSFSIKNHIQIDSNLAIIETSRTRDNTTYNMYKSFFDETVIKLLSNKSVDGIYSIPINTKLFNSIKLLSYPIVIPQGKGVKSKFESNSIYKCDLQRITSIMYCGLIIMIMIDCTFNKSTAIQKYIKYCKFKERELKINFTILEVFCIYFYGSNYEVKQMLKLRDVKKKGILNVLWNCSIDIALFYLTTYKMEPIPVFVTADSNCNKFYNCFKRFRYYKDKNGNTNNEKNVTDGVIKINWLESPLGNSYYNECNQIRKKYVINKCREDNEQLSKRIKTLGMKLENEIIKFYN